jgi:hypothetical protein
LNCALQRDDGLILNYGQHFLLICCQRESSVLRSLVPEGVIQLGDLRKLLKFFGEFLIEFVNKVLHILIKEEVI